MEDGAGAAARTAPKDTVRFNVGGRVFEVLREPTLSLHPGTLLHDLAEEHEGDEPIFVEADADLFPYMLQYFRDRKILTPHFVSKTAVLREAGKFGLTAVTPECIEQEPLPLGNLLKETSRVKADFEEGLEDAFKQSQTQMLAQAVLCIVGEKAMPGAVPLGVSSHDISQRLSAALGLNPATTSIKGWVSALGDEANELVNKRLLGRGLRSSFKKVHFDGSFRVDYSDEP